jgi:tRNA(fMet)-specific endonuclease VapC
VGVVLDSTVVIAAERSGKNPRRVIEDLAARLGDTEATLSVVTVIEIAHGIERANSVERRTTRQRLLDELLQKIAIEPVTVPIAFRAGKIDGELAARGVRVALGDLLIGATALRLGFEEVTHNVRHFKMIPNLLVKEL